MRSRCSGVADGCGCASWSRKDGTAGIFDLRTRAMEQRHRNGGTDAVTSVVWQPRMAIEPEGPGVEPLHKFAFNCEEINQVAISNKGTFLAAADDSGEVKVVDLAEGKLRKALQAAHSNQCAIPPKEAMGGKFLLGSKLYLTSCCLPASEVVRSCEGLGAMCNPPLVHSVAVPLAEVPGRAGKLLAVARGDACVALYDLDFEARRTPTSSGRVRGAGQAERHETSETSGSSLAGAESRDELRNGRLCLLGPKNGGHKAAVSHGGTSFQALFLTTFYFVWVGNRHFANFCSGARHIISGGEDARIKLWRVDEVEYLTAGRKPSISIDHTSKVNWLATSSLQRDNLLAADVTSSISIYNVL
eukprot:SM000105S13903  [mRNA]  locus=s105:478189:480720:+ [translate_table: standard]